MFENDTNERKFDCEYKTRLCILFLCACSLIFIVSIEIHLYINHLDKVKDNDLLNILFSLGFMCFVFGFLCFTLKNRIKKFY